MSVQLGPERELKHLRAGGKSYEDLTFQDIKKTPPTPEQAPWTRKLMELTKIPLTKIQDIVEGEGPAVVRFLEDLKATVKACDGLVAASQGSLLKA